MKYDILPSGLTCQARSEDLWKLSCAGLLGQSRLSSGEKGVWDPSPGPACPRTLPFPQPGEARASFGVSVW